MKRKSGSSWKITLGKGIRSIPDIRVFNFEIDLAFLAFAGPIDPPLEFP